MIIDFLFSSLGALVTGIVSALPVSVYSDTWSGPLGTFVGIFKSFNNVFPVGVILACLAVGIIFQSSSLLYAIGNWIYHHIPFVG